MAGEEYNVEKKSEQELAQEQEQSKSQESGKVIDEANYKIHGPKERKPTVVGRGGDPFFRRINASKEQLIELMEETQTVQDWIQRETCNNVALACLDNENLKEVYFKIKDGFGEYGRMSLMGYKTPYGVEIPRLKIYDTEGNVIEVLTGPLAIDELNKRALAYKQATLGYEEVPIEGNEAVENAVISDYTGNPEDYST